MEILEAAKDSVNFGLKNFRVAIFFIHFNQVIKPRNGKNFFRAMREHGEFAAAGFPDADEHDAAIFEFGELQNLAETHARRGGQAA